MVFWEFEIKTDWTRSCLETYLEIDLSTLTVSNTTLIENLKQNHRDILAMSVNTVQASHATQTNLVSLLQLIQKDNGIRFPSNGLSELTTFLKANLKGCSIDSICWKSGRRLRSLVQRRLTVR